MENSKNTFAEWEDAIEAGNRSYHLSQPLIAISHYQNAINIARRLYYGNFDKSATLAAVITSHHNLAEVFVSENASTLAEKELTEAYQFIQKEIESFCGEPDNLEALLRSMGRIRNILLHFLKSNKSSKKRSVAICNTSALSQLFLN